MEKGFGTIDKVFDIPVKVPWWRGKNMGFKTRISLSAGAT